MIESISTINKNDTEEILLRITLLYNVVYKHQNKYLGFFNNWYIDFLLGVQCVPLLRQQITVIFHSHHRTFFLELIYFAK